MATSRAVTRPHRSGKPLDPSAAAHPAAVGARAGSRARPYVAAVALSGVLLFSLELLSGRLVLPVFGGSPGVWTTTLCFFTAILLVGYLYATWSRRGSRPRAAACSTSAWRPQRLS